MQRVPRAQPAATRTQGGSGAPGGGSRTPARRLPPQPFPVALRAGDSPGVSSRKYFSHFADKQMRLSGSPVGCRCTSCVCVEGPFGSGVGGGFPRSGPLPSQLSARGVAAARHSLEDPPAEGPIPDQQGLEKPLPQLCLKREAGSIRKREGFIYRSSLAGPLLGPFQSRFFHLKENRVGGAVQGVCVMIIHPHGHTWQQNLARCSTSCPLSHQYPAVTWTHLLCSSTSSCTS